MFSLGHRSHLSMCGLLPPSAALRGAGRTAASHGWSRLGTVAEDLTECGRAQPRHGGLTASLGGRAWPCRPSEHGPRRMWAGALGLCQARAGVASPAGDAALAGRGRACGLARVEPWRQRGVWP